MTRSAWERFEALGRKNSVDTSYLFDRYEVYCVSDERTVGFLWRSRHLDPTVLHDASVPRSDLARSLTELRAVHDNLCGTA